jgi:multisubunit Na+/H+ antiporter MnhB subunit
MDIEPGLIIVAVAMVLFYLRLAWLRGRKKRLARLAELESKKKGKQRKDDPESFDAKNRPPYQVGSWWLVGIGAFFMLLGVTMRTAGWFPEAYMPYWWVPATLGVLVFAFSFK